MERLSCDVVVIGGGSKSGRPAGPASRRSRHWACRAPTTSATSTAASDSESTRSTSRGACASHRVRVPRPGARARRNLRVVDPALCDRLVPGREAVEVVVRRHGGELRVHGQVVVLAAGAYGSPAILLPVVPRANTNVPAVVVGERIADELVASL